MVQLIEIVEIPEGKEPLWTRMAWLTIKLVVEETQDGFMVLVKDAISVLSWYNEEAAIWWKNHSSSQGGDGSLKFQKQFCKVVSEPQSQILFN